MKLYEYNEHDTLNQKKFDPMGWSFITIWKCRLKNNKVEQTLGGYTPKYHIGNEIKNFRIGFIV